MSAIIFLFLICMIMFFAMAAAVCGLLLVVKLIVESFEWGDRK